MAMNKRRSRFATGVLLLASVLFGSTIAQAQVGEVPSTITFRESQTIKTSTTITVFWNEPGSGTGGPLLDYQFEYAEILPAETVPEAMDERLAMDDVFQNNIPEDVQVWTIDGLKAATEYAIRIRGQNAAGYGTWSTGQDNDASDDPDHYLRVTTAPAASTGPVDATAPDKVVFHGRIPDFPVTRSHPPASWPSAANSSICRTYRKTAGEESRRRSPVANRWMRP